MQNVAQREALKEARKISANKERLWDYLNDAVDKLGRDASDKDLKKYAESQYKLAGFSPLPWLEKQLLYKEYFH